MASRARPLDLLASTPAAIVALVGILVLWVIAVVGEDASGASVITHQAGYTKLVWYPAALFLLGLLVAAVVVLPGHLRDVPRPVLLALGLLAAFTAWSYLSILWADQQGEAWDGANRTLMYLIVFALFACWRQRALPAAVVLGAWTLGLAVLATVVLVRLPDAHDPLRNFIAFRLQDPAGYPNAAACLFLMPLWPALVLAGRAEVPWPLRGAFAGAAVMLANVALLTQSRGAIYSLPVVFILLLLVVPGRARLLAVLAPVGLALALTVPRVLHGADRLVEGHSPSAVLADIRQPAVIAALVVATVVAAVAAVERYAPIPAATGRRVERGIRLAGIVVAAAAVITALVLAGNPVDRARAAWHSFKKGPAIVQGKAGNRLSAGLGSHRYDAYRVALNDFLHHPVVGVGADNYAEDYLLHRRSGETLRYPHSLVFRTLGQTGLVGALLLAAAFAAALFAALRGVLRRRRDLGGAVAGGATMVFLYWLVHGSFDWFWEFASLGTAAFAMLGLACALHAREPGVEVPAQPAPSRRRVPRAAALAGGAALALAAAISLAVPWLAERDVRAAAREWPRDPKAAFDRLDRAADLNPLSDRPSLVAGSIALRTGDLDRAEHAFAAALGRDSRGSYATLELGLIASERGQRAIALRYFIRAIALDPRDDLAREALTRVRAGRPLSVDEANQELLTKARSVTR